MKEVCQFFLLKLNRGHLQLGHELLAVEERNLTDRQLTIYYWIFEFLASMNVLFLAMKSCNVRVRVCVFMLSCFLAKFVR